MTAEHQPWVIEALTASDPPPAASQSRHPSTLLPDTPGDWVRANLAWDEYLQRHGWTAMRNGYWCRPGKNPRDGHSAELHDDGRLAIWTGEVPDALRALGSQQSDGGISISLYDFIAAYEFAGDRAAFGGHVRLTMMPPPPARVTGSTAEAEADSSEDDFAGSWFKPVDLTEYLDGTHTDVLPTVLRRTDGVAMFYPGVLNGIHGESGLGKGWVVLAAVLEVVRDGGHAIYVDLEDTPKSIASRLRTLGLTRDEIIEHVSYVRPTDPTSPDEIAGLKRLVMATNATLVVIDSLGEAFGLDGINENNDAEVTPWLRKVGRVLADTGACIVIVDHVTKAMENPLYAKGSARKRAQMGGSSFLVEALQPLTKGKGGKLRLTCAKDRNTAHIRGQVSAEMVFSPSGPDDMIVRTFPVGVDEDRTAQEQRDEQVAEMAVEMLRVAKKRRSAFTKTSVVDSTAGARAEIKRAAFDLLVERGHIVDAGSNKFKIS